jgi:cytoskeletal protein CcmA (bactofilin family)
MFKKNEESEWTRFSRALGGTQSAPTREDDLVPADEPEEPATLAQAAPVEPEVYVAPPPSPPPPVVDRDETVMPSYTPPAPPMGSAQVFNDAPRSAPTPAGDGDETVIGEGATIDGTIRSERSIRVLGSVQGEIESSQRVVVEHTAQVQARITGESVTVLGEVNGSITCTGRVEIASSARVTGEVTAGTLSIAEGAFFEGSLKMASARDEA